MDGIKRFMDPRLMISGMTVLFLAALSFGFMRLAFSPTLKSHEVSLERRRLELSEARVLLSKKSDYESEWQSVKVFFPEAQSQEETLNLWVKSLLTFSQSEGILFKKLEPESGKWEKEIRLSLAFEGDIRKLIHFLYHLLEKDPLARIEGFSIRQDEETKTFSYELGLRKALL